MYQKIIHLKNYSNHVKLYTFKNDNNPREEEPLKPKLTEIIDLMQTSEFGLEEGPSKNQNNYFKGSKEHTDIKPPASLEKLQWSSLIIVLLLIAYSVVELVLNINMKNILSTNFEMNYFSYQFINEIFWSSYLLRNLLTIQESKLGNDNDFNQNITLIRDSIDQQSHIIINITKEYYY